MTRRPWDWHVDRMEQLAEALHNGWWAYQIEENDEARAKKEEPKTPGRLGPRGTKDAHPHLMPWVCKEDAGRNQDRFQAAVLLSRRERGFHDTTAEEIHQAWLLWVNVHGGAADNEHATDYAQAHPPDKGDREHTKQAEAVNELFRAWRDQSTES